MTSKANYKTLSEKEERKNGYTLRKAVRQQNNMVNGNIHHQMHKVIECVTTVWSRNDFARPFIRRNKLSLTILSHHIHSYSFSPDEMSCYNFETKQLLRVIALNGVYSQSFHSSLLNTNL